ncbi:holliday junction DNA helicase ruvB family protein [Mycobacterium avium subsp. avium 2285 (R)]|nr:holliday junction DNA helicase ruvB family protein [Mycobacterium avium subsp. avium 2285 (R)]
MTAHDADWSDRDVSGALVPGEGDIDVSLRPRSLREFIGQPRVREQLQLVIEGAKNRGGTPITSFCPARRGWARRRWP